MRDVLYLFEPFTAIRGHLKEVLGKLSLLCLVVAGNLLLGQNQENLVLFVSH